MLRMLPVAALCICLFSSCSDTMGVRDQEVYEKQKASLSGQEKQKPLSFLRLYASSKKNMFGSTVVTGAVSNSATVSSYKNVRLKLLSFDNSGKMLEEHEDVLTGAIKPNNSKDFKLRYHLPKTTDSVAVSIISANVAE